MYLGKHNVPAELLRSVVGYLSAKDVGCVRLVCKELDAVASPYLLTSLWISPASADQEKMLAAAQHPVFSKTVTEIRFDATQTVHQEFSKAGYIRRAICDIKSRFPDIAITKAALGRGYNLHQARSDEQADAYMYTDHDLTLPGTTLPDSFNLCLDRPEKHNEILDYLPSDLASLLVALPQLPKVKSFIISDCRYTHTYQLRNPAYRGKDPALLQGFYPCGEHNYRYVNQGTRGRDAVVLLPRPWVRNDEHYARAESIQAHRYFEVATQVASMLNMTRLEDISVERFSNASGLSYKVFDMSPNPLRHTLRAFGSLRRLQLKLNSSEVPMELLSFPPLFVTDFERVIKKGMFAQILTAASGLETLELQFQGEWQEYDEDHVPALRMFSLNDLFGNTTWPNLSSITFGWMGLSKDELLMFLSRHRETLQRLHLNEVASITRISHIEKEFEEYYDEVFDRAAIAGLLEGTT